MPLYDYQCPSCDARVERLRKYVNRDDATVCACGATMARTVSVPHCLPDGMYSYAPNVGSESAFARRLDAIKNGEKVYQKEA